MIYTDEATSLVGKRRVVLVDDDPVFCGVVRAILARMDGVELAGEAANGAAGVELIERERPDVVVVDWLMPGLSGLELIRKIRSKPSARIPRILLCTAHANSDVADQAFALRVNGFLDKKQSFAVIEMALQAALSGGLFFVSESGPLKAIASEEQPRQAGLLPDAVAVVPVETLSRREREVAHLVVNGCFSKEIASRLGISQRTVESHRSNLMRKLGVSDVATLTRWAMRAGLLDQ